MESGDAESTRRAAHTLKSTGASLGATRLSGLAKQLEQQAQAGDLSDRALAAEVAAAVEETVAAMQAAAADGMAE
jgi:HPt (histidine-containing phosphotransfer) domain-containing protein